MYRVYKVYKMVACRCLLWQLEYRLLAAGLGKSRQVQANLSKSKQVGDDGKSWVASYWQQICASLGKSRQI